MPFSCDSASWGREPYSTSRVKSTIYGWSSNVWTARTSSPPKASTTTKRGESRKTGGNTPRVNTKPLLNAAHLCLEYTKSFQNTVRLLRGDINQWWPSLTTARHNVTSAKRDITHASSSATNSTNLSRVVHGPKTLPSYRSRRPALSRP